MALAFDAYTKSAQFLEDLYPSPYTFTHTPVGTPRGVIVMVVCFPTDGGVDLVSGVTDGGVSMTHGAHCAGRRGRQNPDDPAVRSHSKRLAAQSLTIRLPDDEHERLKALEANPDTRWRVREADWHYYDEYDRYREVAEHVLRRTSTGIAPWVIVDGTDPQYRAVHVGRTLLDRLQRRIEFVRKGFRPRQTAAPLTAAPDERNLLNALILDQPMDKKEYDAQLEKLQGRLALALRDEAFKKRSLVLVFEGMDAAGKGGAIRRVTEALDARQYSLVPIAAPTDEEAAQPYLWRFWRRLPRRGKVTIFDRSWYGRVLVERVEGFCSEADWMRAYTEINDFEDQLVSAGAIVVKLWLSVSSEEQLRRFKAREEASFKRYKITPDDWRNREKWPLYEPAVCDMIDRTSTENAGWTLVEADNKYYARVKILRVLVDKIETALKK